MSTESAKKNHLEGQTSPYLLQHLYNPVDWYAWGDAALSRARHEGKPIFLSIGYAACHWCHVMERESFESADVAALLNRHFVPIKVDREERPDLDEIYMNAVQLLTGQGGWPLSVFLTPELEPFFGGTYFPPEDRYGRPGFTSLLEQVTLAWTKRREEVDRSARELTAELGRIATGLVDPVASAPIGRGLAARAVAEVTSRFDTRHGGFSHAPKFPPDGALGLLLREHARTGEAVPWRMVATTLEGMATGGMYDHVGGGFARYSVDERWLVPHFEKMLYNQALLVPLYADAWLHSQNPLFRRVVEQTLDFVRRELTDRGGGFWSSLDADSEGEEGAFYVWTPEQVHAALGAGDAELFCRVYDITAGGNFEGHSIPNLLGRVHTEALEDRLPAHRARLLEVRGRRPRPATDDKVLTAWNGLAISAFARAHQVFDRPADLESARRAADFALANVLRGGRLLASWRAGHAQLNAYLDDYAFLGRGLVDLYEASFARGYLEAAADLARTMLEHFEDPAAGGFFFTSDDHERLLTRQRSLHDGALPSGAGVAAELLLRLAMHLDDARMRSAAERALASARPAVERMPSAHASLLTAADLVATPPPEVVIVGDPTDAATRALVREVHRRRPPRPVLQVVTATGVLDGLGPLAAGKTMAGGRPTAYVCRNYACERPTTDPQELGRLL